MTDVTHRTYENPDVVAGYIEQNVAKSSTLNNAALFTKFVSGNKVLDLGCGPGHVSYELAAQGYEVTGLDYSSEMIARAKELKDFVPKPTFIVGDMRKLSEYFAENTFDAVWANASLIHIQKQDIAQVLAGIATVSKKDATIFISLKGGSGSRLVKESNYAAHVEREFIFWEEQEFSELVEKNGFKIIQVKRREGRVFEGKPTLWLDYLLTNKKYYANQKNL